MANRGPVVNVATIDGEVPLGSSGIQIQMNIDLVLEGFRSGRIVRVRAMNWPTDALPREEWMGDMEERFPTPDIFP